MPYYYAFEFYSGSQTTTGNPNPLTRKYSIAGDMQCFSDRASRDRWVSEGSRSSDMNGNCRRAVKARDVRSYLLGLPLDQFDDFLLYLKSEA